MSSLLDELLARATTQQECLEQALHELLAIRARYATADGAVTAEVDGNGALVGLRLSESITRRTAEEVGPLITDTVGRAAALAATERAAIVVRLSGSIGVPRVQVG